MNDVCIRRIPLAHIRPDLLEDDKKSGGKLVEAFCGGIFGGSGKCSWAAPFSTSLDRIAGQTNNLFQAIPSNVSSTAATNHRLPKPRRS